MYTESARARQRQRDDLIRRLKSAPCADCGGVFDPVCMDFDHRPGEGKRGKVSTLRSWGIRVLLAEIAKCDVVCANCHRIRTHRQRPAPANRGKSRSK